jgi:hypothetical protein
MDTILSHLTKLTKGQFYQASTIYCGEKTSWQLIRPHMSSQDKTPSEGSSIQTEGKNKWLTLIQNAIKDNEVKENF